MSAGRILVVEDDRDTAELLRLYFSGENYQVETAFNGPDALTLVRKKMPDLIILDIMLPGMDGYEVCKALRSTTWTSHIPIIFLTQKDDHSDLIAGLELGADDYVTKPFEFDELKLRAKNAIANHKRLNLSDPRTGLPSSRLIEEQIRALLRSQGWTYAEITLDQLTPFKHAYGFVAADEVLRFVALLINDALESFGHANDFVGQAGEETFVLITYSQNIFAILDQIQRRFAGSIGTHYNFLDSEQGGIRRGDGSLAPIMTLAAGVVSVDDRAFADIREITEAATEMRRPLGQPLL
jgi:DNA-binding response OmpR family regulator